MTTTQDTTRQFTNDEGTAFTVRIVRRGDSYGLNGCLTHDEDKPLVEFYDLGYMHTQFGQFVSRYYLDTILNHGDYGLVLDCGIPRWRIDAYAMTAIIVWLEGAQ